jgi:transcriptional regulator with XRE-family HTH domain
METFTGVGPGVGTEGSPELSPDTAEIGRRLRQVRLNVGLSLTGVAEQTGLTKGFLSQLERGETSVSIANLLRICSVLGVEPGRLFESFSKDDRPLVRRGERAIGFLNGDGVLEYKLTPASERRFEVAEAHVAPLGTYGRELYSLDLEMGFVYVRDGEVEALFPDRTLHLSTGDALTFSPRELHTFRNPSERDKAVLLFFKSPALL